jgi:hypothetical protein
MHIIILNMFLFFYERYRICPNKYRNTGRPKLRGAGFCSSRIWLKLTTVQPYMALSALINPRLNVFLFRHLLVIFGGLQGLEASVDGDQNLDVTDPSVLFDLYLNTCPSQGSRTIRTEVSRNWTPYP